MLPLQVTVSNHGGVKELQNEDVKSWNKLFPNNLAFGKCCLENEFIAAWGKPNAFHWLFHYQGVWNEKWEADVGNQGNALSENWERNGSRLPWGYLLWKDGLWAQMKNWLKSDRLVNNQSPGPSVRWLCQAADVGVRTLKVWGEHVTCWPCAGRQFFAHTPMLRVGGHWVTKPSSQMHPASFCGRICVFPSHLQTLNKVGTAQNL